MKKSKGGAQMIAKVLSSDCLILLHTIHYSLLDSLISEILQKSMNQKSLTFDQAFMDGESGILQIKDETLGLNVYIDSVSLNEILRKYQALDSEIL